MLAKAAITALLSALGLAAVASPSLRVTGWSLIDATKVADEGPAISQPGYKATGWHAASVPGTVLTSLVNDGVYPEPLYGENNRTIPDDLCRRPYWYRTEIRIPRQYKGKHVWLDFDGINYAAHVWVNGTDQGDIKGAFTRGRFEVTGAVKPGATAGISVRIDPPPHPSVFHEHTLATGTGRNGGAMGADGPTFLATVGWDWMPAIRDRDIGIWQGVSLSASGPVTMSDPQVRTELPIPRTDSAVVKVAVTLRNATNQEQKGLLQGSVPGTDLSVRVPVDLAPGALQIVKAPDLGFNHPRLWWPNGYGRPDLYSLHLEFVEDGAVSDSSDTSFGIRSIQYFPPGGKTLTVIVNGVPVFCKGGNWGMDEAMKRIPRKRLEAQIRLHRDANFTMIRNWIGMSTEADFYDLCDRYGILIFDEFWLANPYDGPDPLDPDLFLANAREKILRYRNHPSIAFWCGRNEGNAPPNIEPGLEQLQAKLDPDRMYQRNSARYNGLGGGGPYSNRPIADYFRANDGLHSEIGAPSIPTLQAIQAMMPPKDWWPINDDWAEHDLCKGAQGGDRYPAELAKRFGPYADLAGFAREAQLQNFETYRAIFEGRDSKLFQPATGTLLWMSNPAQPSFVWQIYSYDLEPNSAMFGCQCACEPIHIQYNPRSGRIELVNNLPSRFRGTAKFHIYELDGKRSLEGAANADVGPSTVQDLMALPDAARSRTDVYFLALELHDTGGHLVSRNLYWESAGDDFSALQTLPAVKLALSSRQVSAPRGTIRVEATLTNSGTAVALMAHLQLRGAKSGNRVLPVFYSDNYVSLLPGERRVVSVEASQEDLHGERPVLALDGWNVN